MLFVVEIFECNYITNSMHFHASICINVNQLFYLVVKKKVFKKRHLVAQTRYTHVRKCKNDKSNNNNFKIKTRKKDICSKI
jgi:hypothetical protein